MSPALTPRCWPIARLLSRNPLVRRNDRIEALTLCLATALALVAIPFSFLVHSEVHAAQTERNIAILGAHLAANDGDVDFATLEQMLETGAPPTVH